MKEISTSPVLGRRFAAEGWWMLFWKIQHKE